MIFGRGRFSTSFFGINAGLFGGYVKRRSDSEFRNIVFSIQKKQGEIIKAPFQQNMIIQGCAGAGKSMIMFHRLSVLIYKAEQERYSRIFVITPSKTYMQMAGNMLYELEIQHIHMGTLKQYYDYCLQKYNIQKEDIYHYPQLKVSDF